MSSPSGLRRCSTLRELAKDRPLTLLTATKQPDISEAMVLADILRT